MTTLGVALAGGRSQRFGKDKLAALLDGTPLLAHVLRHLKEVTATVAVSVESEEHAERLRPILPSGTRIILDPPGRSETGPLGGILATLAVERTSDLLFVAGDMPWLEGKVLAALEATTRAAGFDAACPWGRDGRVEPLVLWVRKGAGRRLVESPAAAAFPRRRSTDLIRSVSHPGIVPTEQLGGTPLTFANVNTREDLERSRKIASMPMGPSATGEPRQTCSVPPDAPRAFWEAREAVARGRPEEALDSLGREAEVYRDFGIPLLEYHCLTDAYGVMPEGHREDPERRARRARLKAGFPDGGRG